MRCSSFAQVESRTFFAASGVGAFPKIAKNKGCRRCFSLLATSSIGGK